MQPQVTQALYALNQDLGATLAVIAHPSKSDGAGESVRGAGELSADMDVIWSVSRSGDNRTMRCRKDRDGDLNETEIRFSVVKGADRSLRLVGKAADASPDVRSHVLELLRQEDVGGGIPVAEVARSVISSAGVSRSVAYRVIKALRESGAVREHAGRLSLPAPPEAGAVPGDEEDAG